MDTAGWEEGKGRVKTWTTSLIPFGTFCRGIESKKYLLIESKNRITPLCKKT